MFIEGELYAGNNDSLLSLIGLKNGADETWINNATVTAELRDSQGVLVPGMSWPETLSYIAGSDGNYQLSLDAALNLAAGHYYQLRIIVDAGGLSAQWDISIQTTHRG